MGLAYFIAITLAGHIVLWLQCNSQLVWPWAASNPVLIALVGFPVSYAFIRATAHGYSYFGELWPLRIIGFSIGTMVFAFMTMAMMGEGISVKTAVSLMLCVAIILVQAFF